jgi:chemotaxis protein histidine kinase CheA
VFLEPKTDRVRASFAIAPIRRLHHSDAHDDARTIARLAMAMLTGEVDPRAYEGETLAELRPDLPEQLVSATAALLDAKSGDQEPDVAAYLALIGMADPVAAGEAERERIRAEILDEQNAERERLAAERAAFEQTMATERATFEQTMATERAAFERVQEQAREKLERAQTQERDKLERERQELQAAATRERESLQRAAVAERTQVAAKRAELEKAEKRLTAQRAKLERVAARDRQQLADLREALRQAGEREIELKRATALDEIADREDELDRPDLVAPTFVAPMLTPLEPFRFDDSPLMSEEEIVFAPSRMAEPEPDVVEATGSPTPADEVGAPSAPNRRRWILAGSAAAILALLGITASMLGGRNPARQPAVQLVVPTTRTSAASPTAPPARAIPSPSAAEPEAPAAPVALVLDSASSRAAARWLDSLKEAHPVELPRRVRIVREPAADERPRERPAPIERPRPSITEDPFFIPGSTPVPRDTVVRRDSVPPPRIRR